MKKDNFCISKTMVRVGQNFVQRGLVRVKTAVSRRTVTMEPIVEGNMKERERERERER